NRRSEGQILQIIGDIHFRRKDYREAIRWHQLAAQVAQELQYSELLWQTYFGIARIREAQEQWDEALKYYRSAAEVIESLRLRLPGPEEKAVFLQNKVQVFERVCHILLRLYLRAATLEYDREAFHYAEAAKARALLDLLEE